MSPISRILCGVDFSEPSHKAFQFADALAQSLHAELLVVHAFSTPATLDIAGQTRPADASLRPRLESVRSSSPDVRTTHILHAGPPEEVICWLAQEHQCQLVVIGTHGRGGLSHALFGSVAEFVVRHARCPVVTVRNIPPDRPPLREPMVLPLPPPPLM